MKNVLLNVYEFHSNWAKPTLKKVLKKGMKAVILTMTHGDEIPDKAAWEKLYLSGGPVHTILTKAFGCYGITDVTFVGMFHHTPAEAKELILHAEALFITGGLPHLFYERAQKWDLVETIRSFDGIVMGASAGAMVQMKEYHVTPDKDYDRYGYYKGLGLLDGFEPEVHFSATQVQLESIARYQKERKKMIFAMANDGGVLVEGDRVSLFGNVEIFPEDEE